MKYARAVFYFGATLAIYLGFSLLGWGLDDVPGFFAMSPRFGYALIVIAFAFAVGYQAVDTPEGIDGGKGEEGKRVRRQTFVAVGMTLFMFGSLMFLPFADRHETGVVVDAQSLRWLGLAFSGIGYALIFWSGIALGKQYSAEVTIQKDHQLITTGLYHSVRHPRYLGVISLAIGSSLLFRSWLGLAASVILVGVLLVRIQDEESLMRREFGSRWDAYCQQSWRLLPYLY